MAKRGLGRGLESLLPTSHKPGDIVTDLPLSSIVANTGQPRKDFDEESLGELATSIQEHGLVQPIVVRTLEKGKYQIIAGERRWRAYQQLGHERIPALIREVEPEEAQELALVENLQRQDLNPLEEAEAFRCLLQEHGFTQERLAKRLGKSRPYIANSLRLLALPVSLQNWIRQGKLSPGHGKALLALADDLLRERIGEEVMQEGLSVRETEKLVQALKEQIEQEQREAENSISDSPEVITLEQVREKKEARNFAQTERKLALLKSKLSEILGSRIKIKPTGEWKGRIEIEFGSREELDQLEKLLGLQKPEKA